TNNWMGPVGAYASDVLFQIFGFAAFLLPLAIAVLGWRWCRTRAIDSQFATLAGYFLLLVSLPSLLALFPFPAVRGAIPAGGIVGSLISSELLAGRSEEHTSELQSPCNSVCRPLLDKN